MRSSPSPSSTGRSSLLPFLFLVSLLALVHSTAALPAARSVQFEPLFRPASSNVGPARSIERLRLRRAFDSVLARREVQTPVFDKRAGEAVRNSNVKRAMAAPNPKAKRSSQHATRALERRQLGLPPIVPNPKTKRSLGAVPSSPVNLRRRSSGLPAVVSNPKKRSLDLEKRAILEATVTVTPSSKAAKRSSIFDTVKRFISGSNGALERRANLTDAKFSVGRIGTVKIVPNPKAPSFSVDTSSSAVASSASPTYVSAPYSTVTIPFTTTPLSTTTLAVSTSSIRSSSTTTKASTSKSSTTKSTTTTKASTTKTTTTTTKTTTTVAASSTSTTWPSHGGQIAGGYYPDWVEDVMPPESIDFKLFDLINYSFAIPGSDYKVTLSSDSGKILKRVVQYAHGNNTKVLIAVGGWTDSEYFSGAVSTASRRTAFVKSIVTIVDTYNLDGVDIDWEYPGTQGDSANVVSTKDTANLLLFLQALRTALPDTRLSTCTTQQTYVGANGDPIGDVSAYAALLDNILVMNYDVWGASSTPGPNAPLTDGCDDSLQPTANMASAVAKWTAAGMPASKIIMGVPAYGYISASTATSLVHKRDNIPTTGLSNRHLANLVHKERNLSAGHRWYLEGQRKAAGRRRARRALKRQARQAQTEVLAKRGSVVVCPNNHSGKPCEGVTGQNISDINWNPLVTNTSTSTNTTDGVFNPGSGPGKVGKGDLSGLEGNQIQFVDLINYGVIVKDSSNNWVGTNGYTRVWDSCSSTPFLYDTSRSVVITYDDPESLGLKGQLANTDGLAGLAMWDISGDTADFQLTQSFRSSMGLDPLGS